MAYRLATVAGRVDVDQMLAELTPQQMDEWIAYDRLEPIGLVRQNRMIALITAAVAQVKSSGGAAVPIDDLYPMGVAAEPQALSPAAVLARFQLAASSAAEGA